MLFHADFLFVRYRSIQYGHILILLLAFPTLISFLQENKLFAYAIRAGHMSRSLNLQLSSSSVGYFTESANPIVEHVQVSEKNTLKELGVVVSPSTVKKMRRPSRSKKKEEDLSTFP